VVGTARQRQKTDAADIGSKKRHGHHPSGNGLITQDKSRGGFIFPVKGDPKSGYTGHINNKDKKIRYSQ
jgi:hypothetical protein